MQEKNNKQYRPYVLVQSGAFTPDNPEFYKVGVNLVILTKYGRGIYIRHGNEDRCSSFFATLGTIVNKLQISFGRRSEEAEVLANVKCIRQRGIVLYVLRRLNYLYICWSKEQKNEIGLYGMMEFVHHQLMSCLTGKVNTILQTNQTYNPSINFGNSKAEQRFLNYAFQNGLKSVAVSMKAIPVMPLPLPTRNTIYQCLKQMKTQGLKINMLLTLTEIVYVYKQKGIDLTTYDVLLFYTLIQSQSYSVESQIWYPICLPGVCMDERVFCYMSFITKEIIHVMVSVDSQLFGQLSSASKKLKSDLDRAGVIQRINLTIHRDIITDPTFQKPFLLEHFMVRHQKNDDNGLDQMIMSSGCYFGENQEQIRKYMNIYDDLHLDIVRRKHQKKEKLGIKSIGKWVCVYHEQGGNLIMFVASQFTQLDQCKVILNGLEKWIKEDEQNLWINRFV